MIYLIIWSHFISDFILQTHKMASNKSSSNGWLAAHIAAYITSLFAIMVWLAPIEEAFFYCIVNGAAHLVTDYVTSRITKKLWAEKRVHDFFVVIGLDQAIHMTTLMVTLPFLRHL